MTPGHPDAIRAGCLCPIIDNGSGRGQRVDEGSLFMISAGCPVHAGEELDDDLRERAAIEVEHLPDAEAKSGFNGIIRQRATQVQTIL